MADLLTGVMQEVERALHLLAHGFLQIWPIVLVPVWGLLLVYMLRHHSQRQRVQRAAEEWTAEQYRLELIESLARLRERLATTTTTGGSMTLKVPPHTAAERSLRLLKEMLSTQQREEFEQRGHFHVIGSRGGHYRITPSAVYSVRKPDHVPMRYYCIVQDYRWFEGARTLLPYADLMLAKKLLIETDESKFRQIAILQ